MAVIDSHVHVWDLERAHYDWPDGSVPEIFRSIGLDEVRPSLAAAGVDRVVLVQAADDPDDTATMLRTADRHDEVAGIVAYAPLERPQEAHDRLVELRRDPRVVGVRTLIHDQPDPDWILRPDVDEGLGVLEALGVPFDYVAVLPRHLEHLPALAERHPSLRIVIDHLAKPPIGDPGSARWPGDTWSVLMARAAENPLLSAKVSGLYSATADAASWTQDQVRPFVEEAHRLFGPDRLLYGGDWPVSLTAGGYARCFDALSGIFADWPAADRAAVLGDNARRFYGLPAED
ncbi:amidohydrolase family protein [Frondihabitans peucedani]|uniref:Amidohydrolase family protein n=1 Tax=Frondihabitans peucedani TaxID=598626 RepID=A0ABP8E4J6_9MICO